MALANSCAVVLQYYSSRYCTVLELHWNLFLPPTTNTTRRNYFLKPNILYSHEASLIMRLDSRRVGKLDYLVQV